MSRVGKNPIDIPGGVDVSIQGNLPLTELKALAESLRIGP